jgi:hypothetical protein
MPLKPWYTIVTPREDLRESRPLDASEFAVHLDQVRSGSARPDYQDPQRFFERTYLTKNLTGLTAEVLRRLSGVNTETSAVFNLTTQFGGGKTHALTLLYHLAKNGPKANGWLGVGRILERADLAVVPQAAVAVFVGTEFDALTGRGGTDGTPLRKTPWGEIAYQLGGEKALSVLKQHEHEYIEPKGDVIREFLPKDRPVLILMDEILTYCSTYRKLGYHDRLYNFIMSLSETARSMENVALVISLPSSVVFEFTTDDANDQARFEHMVNRLGKAVMMSEETEIAEIIRRRLFEWDPRGVTSDGRIILPREAQEACEAYANWIIQHRTQLPGGDFPIDQAKKEFLATYPFHPSVLSVFERKWQVLPRFQRTRGVLRLLALWISRAYQEGYQGAQRDPLLSLGTAPLEDTFFRAALLEQLGDKLLEAAITTDIVGHSDSHAARLDEEAPESICKQRLHRKVATSIFFESKGGQIRGEATVPEIRLAVSDPDLDIGNVETVLEALRNACYYLRPESGKYRYDVIPNINKILADRRANIPTIKINDLVTTEIESVFKSGNGIEKIFFPEQSGDIPNRPVLTMVILSPEHTVKKEDTLWLIEQMTRESGNSGRTFKSALIWMVAEDDQPLRDAARQHIAWEMIQEEYQEDQLRLDDQQKRDLAENIAKSKRDLREAVWRQYKNLMLLDKENEIKTINLGLVHSSAADTMSGLILNRLRNDAEINDQINPSFLVRNWISTTEWSTLSVRDAFFASPRFPRLTNPEAIKETIARGVSSGIIAYVAKGQGSEYESFIYNQPLTSMEVEISEDMYLITRETAENYLQRKRAILTSIQIEPANVELAPGQKFQFSITCLDQYGQSMQTGNAIWGSEGGNIDQKGHFQAGSAVGQFSVSVLVGEFRSIANIVIKEGAVKSDPETPVSTTPYQLSHVGWNGVIPWQKWTIFYNKVLARFATGFNLKISVQVDIDSDKGISPQKVDETRAALTELGMDDNIQIE